MFIRKLNHVKAPLNLKPVEIQHFLTNIKETEKNFSKCNHSVKLFKKSLNLTSKFYYQKRYKNRLLQLYLRVYELS